VRPYLPLAATFAICLAACGGDTSTVQVDASTGGDATASDAQRLPDARGDSGTVPDAASPDAASDAASADSGQDAPSADASPADAGQDVVSADAAADAGPTDSGQDAATDASSFDAAIDAPLDSSTDAGAGCSATPPTGSCATNGRTCTYPAQSCVCSFGAPVASSLHWICLTLSAGCPDPEPAVGSSCTQSGLVCDYGACIGGTAVQCNGSTWAADHPICPG
jgi:hypothetical protein